MKNYPSQSEYLKKLGYDRNTPEQQLLAAKKSYRSAYLKEYRRRNKKRIKRCTIRLTTAEHTSLVDLRNELNRKSSFSCFMKDSAIAYLTQNYLIPDPELRNALLLSIRKIGNNVNQIIQKLHSQIRFKNLKGEWNDSTPKLHKLLDTYEPLVHQLAKLEQIILDYTMNPPSTLIGVPFEEIKHDRAKIKKLLEYLYEHLESMN